MLILNEGYRINEYTVQYLIKEGPFNSTYKVTDKDGASRFMKFYDPDLVPEKLHNGNEISEIVNSRLVKDENIISYVDDGIVEIDGKTYCYLIMEYFVGSLLSESLNAGKTFDEAKAKSIIIDVFKGLSYLHNALELCHNDITPRNIILQETKEGLKPRIIDLGHTNKPTGGTVPFTVEDLTLPYCAPEALAGIFRYRSDVFSATAVLYHMLTGKAPWDCVISADEPIPIKKRKVRAARKGDLDIEALKSKGISKATIDAIVAGLTLSDIERPGTDEMIHFIDGTSVPQAPDQEDQTGLKKFPGRHKHDEPEAPPEPKASIQFENCEEGGGFDDVAGMENLKEELRKRVIWVISDKEKAKKYRLTPPNGMILYGPPGCGKTFFAQKFAEESKFKFTMVSGSDLGSIYMHGTQGKIASIFKEAEKNAPAIICFDEFDSFVPARNSRAAEQRSEEVNEFLAQLNNCASKGIFVIGTTNMIELIDPAVLRKGRMDLHFMIPAPDTETRKNIFLIHLKDRPLADDINADELAALTENYSSSDIAFIVNEAAMTAALADLPIMQQHLVNSIKCNQSSLGGPKGPEPRKIGFK